MATKPKTEKSIKASKTAKLGKSVKKVKDVKDVKGGKVNAERNEVQKLEATVYDMHGKETRKIALPAEVFAVPWNADLLHQVVTALASNARAGTAHVKMRGEVRGGGKKPWRQKGTSRARHGSRRSPIWVGGGVAHGPRNVKDYSKKINRIARAKAFGVALSRKLKDNQMIFVESLTFSVPKTKDARTTLSALSKVTHVKELATKRRNNALIALSGRDSNIELSFRNFNNIAVKQVKDINPIDVLHYRYMVIVHPEEAVGILASRMSAKRANTTKN